MRRVPFSVKDKVTAKVNELLEKDIIEKVEGPTVWVSPVVVAPKPLGDIRLCVDMRRANEAIIRERLPIPTIDEVLESLNGSGVFFVLVQEKKRESRAVCYASRSLSQVERGYSQTEKEALALVWACERFHLYLYGLPQFDLVTDHEALKVIYSRKSKPSARIERWVLRLQPYNYQVCYVP